MCGIVGYVGKNSNALQVLICGLESLEYRGYDSAGIAFVNSNKLEIVKETGKIVNLKEEMDDSLLVNVGIGHTRWATHGVANQINSHPHHVGKMTIVHNGIIENYIDLKKDLINDGYKFVSETDTEVACALLDRLYNINHNMIRTIVEFQKKVRGAYALGVICNDDLNTIYAVKKYSPLIIGIGNKEHYIASDVPAILKYTNRYITLEDGEFASLTSNTLKVFNESGKTITKDIKTFDFDGEAISKNGYSHFMLKEMLEQPDVIKKVINEYLEFDDEKMIYHLPNLKKYNHIYFVACGSAYHAALVGKRLIEEYGNIPVNVEIASEFRYKKLFLTDKDLVIAISQSGETADTLAAVKIAKSYNCDTLSIINVFESSIARETKDVIYTKAGAEIAVATTKGYLTQVMIMSLMAMQLNGEVDVKIIKNNIMALPNLMRQLLDKDYQIVSDILVNEEEVFYIGRGIDYAIALEATLKLKEISYNHAETYPAGELKHGTISLIKENTPVIAIVTDARIAEKTISNIKEVKSRGAKVILVISEKLDFESDLYDQKIVIPTTSKYLEPLLVVLPLQMIAFNTALKRGCDIDKPRNLAKSVTVE